MVQRTQSSDYSTGMLGFFAAQPLSINAVGKYAFQATTSAIATFAISILIKATVMLKEATVILKEKMKPVEASYDGASYVGAAMTYAIGTLFGVCYCYYNRATIASWAARYFTKVNVASWGAHYVTRVTVEKAADMLGADQNKAVHRTTKAALSTILAVGTQCAVLSAFGASILPAVTPGLVGCYAFSVFSQIFPSRYLEDSLTEKLTGYKSFEALVESFVAKDVKKDADTCSSRDEDSRS